jgi:4-amino-4-deoxy-L-arabinose transferase-like glycosyltransferase
MIQTRTSLILVLIVAAGLGLRLAYCAFLSDRIRHDADAALFRRAHATGRSVREVAQALAVMGPERTAALLAEWSRPESPDVSPVEVPAAAPLAARPVPGSDPYECEIIADNLSRGAGYRGMSWGHPEVHPTACRPPLTPVTWAVWFAFFGHRFDVVRLADVLYGTLSLVLLFLIGRRIFNERVGLMATAALAVWPQAILLTAGLMTETLFLMLELLFVWFCLRAGDRPTLARFAAAGLCAGLATLTRPNLLALLPFLPLWSAVVFRRDWRALAKSLAVPAVAAATIAPWAYRNLVIFHQFIPVSTQSGTNFLIGNNELALKHPDMMGYLIDEESTDFEERARGLNEAERDELALRMAKAWLWENRDRWGLLVWTKIKMFCSPVLHQPDRLARWAMLLSWGVVLPLALPALVVTSWSFTRDRKPGVIVQMLILSSIGAYLIVYVVPRYRFPIEPFFIVLATATVDWLVIRVSAQRAIKTTPFAVKEG